MLSLRRRVGECVYIGDEIVIQVTEINNTQVKIGIEAPRDVPIQREELRDMIARKTDRPCG